MRLASFSIDAKAGWGEIRGDQVFDCSGALGGAYPDLRSALAADAVANAVAESGPGHAIADITFLPVVPSPGKIVCVGLNYREHREEAGRAAIEKPTLFMRAPSSQMGHLQPLVRAPEIEFLDYEGEIAVVIGKPGRRIAEADAWAHVAGYAPYNDASARDWQGHSSQWTAGKNFDATGGFGPWMATRGAIEDGAALTLETRVNGQLVQSSDSSRMIFSIPTLIAYVSTFATLLPGDVIVTGTPSGVGKFRDPQINLADGDVVEVAVGGVGVLRNRVEVEPRPDI